MYKRKKKKGNSVFLRPFTCSLTVIVASSACTGTFLSMHRVDNRRTTTATFHQMDFPSEKPIERCGTVTSTAGRNKQASSKLATT